MHSTLLASPLSSHSMLSSSSSRSSTFSDLSASASSSSFSTSSTSPPQSTSGAKTHAFFASPFSTRPPSPTPPPPPPKDKGKEPVKNPPTSAPARSLTADFFSTPVRPPSPPLSSVSKSPPPSATSHATGTTSGRKIHPARIFPSRYKASRDPIQDLDDSIHHHSTTTIAFSSSSPSRTRKPEFLVLDPATDTSLLSDGNQHFLSPPSPSHLPSPWDDPDRTKLPPSLLLDTTSPSSISNANLRLLSPSPISRDASTSSSESASSSYSSTSSATSILPDAASKGLPTPPRPAVGLPPAHAPVTVQRDNVDGNGREDEATPRPPNLQPSALTMLLRGVGDDAAVQDADYGVHGETQEEEDAPPGPGAIITSSPPRILPPSSSSIPPSSQTNNRDMDILSPTPSPMSPSFFVSPPPDSSYSYSSSGASTTPTQHESEDRTHTPTTHTPTPDTPTSGPMTPTSPPPSSFSSSFPSSSSSTALRLLKPLGQGAFSSVWLADDLSPTPLALSSRKSVRDLRRAARSADSGSGGAGSKPVSRNGSVKVKRSGSGRDKERDRNEHEGGVGGGSGEGQMKLPRTGSVHMGLSLASIPSFSSLSLSLSRNASLKKFRERVQGTRPASSGLGGRTYLDERHGEMGVLKEMKENELSRNSSLGHNVQPPPHESNQIQSPSSTSSTLSISPPSSSNASMRSPFGSLKRKQRGEGGRGRLVAVKMTPRRVELWGGGGARAERERREEEERTRVGFVREVEVLRHISHPNITPLLTHFSTLTHHVLVLPYLQGGDLLGLVNGDVAWGKLSESVLRRIWQELCKAVGWMHGVGLVHRDIKLENILLTMPAFSSLTESSPRPSLADFPLPPAPIIKLTDFGLSRFIEIDENGEAELLSTRCGSEAYAAPELVMGGSGSRSGGKGGRGVYDARETDAWACGVVLYALVGRKLPFGEGVSGDGQGKIGGERAGWEGVRASVKERRAWLMKIAKGEWTWPEFEEDASSEVNPENSTDGELVGKRLALSAGAKRIVSRLLVRDPRKRARIGELWDDEWMRDSLSSFDEEEENELSGLDWGMGFMRGGLDIDDIRRLLEEVSASSNEGTGMDIDEEIGEEMDVDFNLIGGGEDEDEDEDEEVDEDGLLLDQDGIHSIARQEVV
ncbi:hypothetical protein BDQ12DRAFT_688985 [Crucibulum laeve]|uniref:Protein kinase domain-containing protein n=1 Tax=Crucibulum laeve TaxID=68775 RepID=A0A5C3LPY8_9AGAR|nr:hypothetical protein BDQ12DRAFT_688985 [Crucibulum laeve]